mmetsp:Transcript_71966/g.126821  ORF Transcript_71966/g.126821 Transcript_71966/m.126821 type:complete len:137 (-) Transcript_71966:52-462(-)
MWGAADVGCGLECAGGVQTSPLDCAAGGNVGLGGGGKICLEKTLSATPKLSVAVKDDWLTISPASTPFCFMQNTGVTSVAPSLCLLWVDVSPPDLCTPGPCPPDELKGKPSASAHAHGGANALVYPLTVRCPHGWV